MPKNIELLAIDKCSFSLLQVSLKIVNFWELHSSTNIPEATSNTNAIAKPNVIWFGRCLAKVFVCPLLSPQQHDVDRLKILANKYLCTKHTSTIPVMVLHKTKKL
jgi:hypothetical protein